MDFAQRTRGGHNIKGSFSAGAEDVGRGIVGGLIVNFTPVFSLSEQIGVGADTI